MGRMVEKPRYGGIFIGCVDAPLAGFDEAYNHPSGLYATHLTLDELLVGDWARGPSGTGEASWLLRGVFLQKLERGAIAESWEIPDNETLIYHIRRGVHWQDKPPVNGRELNANDVVFTFNRLFSAPLSYLYTHYGKSFKSVEAPDKWTVVVKCVPGEVGVIFKYTSEFASIVAPEVIEKYGDMREWQNVIGTGPFMLTDYVPGSSVTLERNPNYWDVDPLHPENQLPYLDGVTWLVIPDASTRMASLRTHKTDWQQFVTWEEAASLQKTNPELKYIRWLQAAHLNVIYGRVDKPELPFKDIRVRRALAMAIDNEAIKRDYYGGNAELFSTPVAPYPEIMDMFTPLEEQSEIVQEYYGYHPEKAKQLLAEAGYPDGFKTEIVCTSPKVDTLSIIKAYWADIGVDLKLDVKESAVFRSIAVGKTHKEMIFYAMATVAPHAYCSHQPGGIHNYAMINDPRCNEAWDVVRANVVVNDEKANQALKEVFPYILDQCWHIETPSPYLYIFWQPWVKGYSGAWTVGYNEPYAFPTWIWYDQDLKEEMTGKR